MIKSIKKAIEVLSLFTSEKHEFSISEVGSKIHCSYSTAFRILSTLKQGEFLEQDSSTYKYSLGPKALELAGILISKFNIRSVCFPYMVKLRDETGDTITLSLPFENGYICIEQVLSESPIKYSTDIGKMRPYYAGATGKVLLANMPDEILESYFQKSEFKPITENTITDPAILRNELNKIRIQGYAHSEGERVIGSLSLSTPIKNYVGNVVAAIAIGSVQSRKSVKDFLSYANLLKETAVAISKEIGYIEKS